ncbi:MAG: helix-turn-helix domain-containing protein [Bacteroidales bacterium]|nr:helix-turn-helix domain-containing protein [Bacteroidales bacterium]
MKEPRILSEILKDYFQSSNEPLAVNFRRHFNIKQAQVDQLSNEEIDEMLEKSFLEDWIDNQDVMQILHISPRTLQTLRSNGILPFSRIGNKLYYRRSDISRILNNHYTMVKIKYYGGKK